MSGPPKNVSRRRSPAPTGIAEIDGLAALPSCTVQDYVRGVSAYVRRVGVLGRGPQKAAQIRLSNALARALATDLGKELPHLTKSIVTDEKMVGGGLRTGKADVSESHPLDGLRLAVELKPINLAVGRAIWNRFGDLRTFAVNIHLKFPFAVVGGVLVVPTYEEVGTTAAREAEAEEHDEGGVVEAAESSAHAGEATAPVGAPSAPQRKSTEHLIKRAIDRLVRAGGRESEADASHLLEGIAVIVFDPDADAIHPELPQPGSGLRWEEFINTMVTSYRARFEI